MIASILTRLFGNKLSDAILASAWGYISSFVLPIKEFLAIVIALVIFDFWSGVSKARKKGEKITANGFRNSIRKATFYSIAILAAEGMKMVFMPVVPLTYMTAFGIAVTEFKSIIENIEEITGASIWKTIKSYIESKTKG